MKCCRLIPVHRRDGELFVFDLGEPNGYLPNPRFALVTDRLRGRVVPFLGRLYTDRVAEGPDAAKTAKDCS